ncbi:hypothetical protein P7C73_g6873, partial [Tremellales sp. Uapishka_1]
HLLVPFPNLFVPRFPVFSLSLLHPPAQLDAQSKETRLFRHHPDLVVIPDDTEGAPCLFNHDPAQVSEPRVLRRLDLDDQTRKVRLDDFRLDRFRVERVRRSCSRWRDRQERSEVLRMQSVERDQVLVAIERRSQSGFSFHEKANNVRYTHSPADTFPPLLPAPDQPEILPPDLPLLILPPTLSPQYFVPPVSLLTAYQLGQGGRRRVEEDDLLAQPGLVRFVIQVQEFR